MAVKIRLTRIGKKRQPSYRVVVTDARSPRDGHYIEQIGRYDPRQEPSLVEIDNERAAYWLANGAQPSSQARKLLQISGAVSAPAARRPARPAKVHVVEAEAQKAAAAEDEAVIEAALIAEDEASQAATAGDAEPKAEEPGEAGETVEGSSVDDSGEES